MAGPSVPEALRAALPQGTRLVLYDGECGLCRRSVRWLLARDPRGRLRFAPLQGETARALGVAPRELETVLLVEVGPGGAAAVHERSAAIARALGALGGGWALAGRALRLAPRPLADAGYRLVAAHRHRLGPAACALPGPDERARFLP
ncbi:thiol-disulfide oxidoreductase DCC family protein [Anaeromyxobacter paludicola]|uniref:DUF393 domain-containing protein n=1 Tax=Anaeromyxobacter paludicola TaxID=2918171 RepID=A0ABM7XFZ2_9BACT|nr:DCC1-like thiol-disulfide oxidoreductase family protein [Anaeromyxobacter paludicola]BDG10814.1 hypothetical protein AMPC_39270 [Anaeromyxobacter paludicola]